MIRELELSVPTPEPVRREEGMETELSINDQRFNQSCLSNETSMKMQKNRFWRAARSVNAWRFAQNVMLRECFFFF